MKSNSKTPGLLGALMLSGLVALMYFGAWSVGITPASQGEREFITQLAKSPFGADPAVKAAVDVANNATYISRRHFFKAETAFQTAQIGNQ